MRKSTDFIIIHCSATRPSQDIGVAEIDRWHRQRGFLSVGYHYVIRRDGTLETGRSLYAAGAHARGFNHNSVGICMVGGVTEGDVNVAEDNFTDTQKEALVGLVESLTKEFPEADVIGHRQVAAKACPSFDVRKWAEFYEFPFDPRERIPMPGSN
jgi:N-acetylmuramoyl-L-alanine amidase